jgi:hypothetical protein
MLKIAATAGILITVLLSPAGVLLCQVLRDGKR